MLGLRLGASGRADRLGGDRPRGRKGLAGRRVALAKARRRGSSVFQNQLERGVSEGWSFPHLRDGSGHLRPLLETPASNVGEVSHT